MIFLEISATAKALLHASFELYAEELLDSTVEIPSGFDPAVDRTRAELESIREKLSSSGKSSAAFDLNESRHLYAALWDTREDIRGILENTYDNADRELALENQKLCNALLRELRKTFESAGIDIRQALGLY